MLTLVGLLVIVAQGPEGLNLNLLCEGSGSQGKPVSAFGHVNTADGSWANGTITSWRDEGFSDAVRIEIKGSGGRIRIPQSMLPPIRGGKNGWMALKKVEASADEITAQATINFINTAKIRIDRITGTLSLGAKKGHFTGRCQAYDPDTVERAF